MIVAVLILSILFGSIIGYFFNHKKNNLTRIILTFSGAFLLTSTILEIFPHIYNSSNANIGLFILGGVFIQILLEAITHGAEHGHLHFNNKKSFPYSIFIGLAIHSFLEGIPLQNDTHHHLLYTIAIHKIPVAIVLSAFIFRTKTNRLFQVLLISIFALTSPLGYWFGEYISTDKIECAMAVVAGIFLHISTVIIFESSDGHSLKLKKLIALILGFSIAYLTVHHH